MNIVLFDIPSLWEDLLPLTFTRPVSEIRIGILKISEKWQKHLQANISYATKEHLQKRYTADYRDDNLIINSALLPDDKIIQTLKSLPIGKMLFWNDLFIAGRLNEKDVILYTEQNITTNVEQLPYTPNLIQNYCEIFSKNAEELTVDFKLITQGRKSVEKTEGCTIIGKPDLIFLEEGAKVQASVLNTTNGPVYIGKDAEVMEGCMIRGPFALGEHSALKMGAKIYGATTIGPHSKVGGEVNNSVIFGYSNKAHDGFLGNSVLGEWCNLGADTNNSNLKNNYAIVKMWNYSKQRFVSTGLQFAGLIMGDHSKCGINTMFNTGTVVGVACNLFGDGFHRNFVPSFSWGGAQGYTHYQFDKAIETTKLVYSRRNMKLSSEDIEILEWIYQKTEQFRNY